MKKPFRVYLKAGERLFVNGAVLRVDRKVAVEFLNDVDFLLENNVLQAEEATTPFRQLYFVLQAIIIDRANSQEARRMYSVLHENFLVAFDNAELRQGLHAAKEFVDAGRFYDALRIIRALYQSEDKARPGAASAAGKPKEMVAPCS